MVPKVLWYNLQPFIFSLVLVLKCDFNNFHLYSLFASSKSNYLQTITLFVPFKLENSDSLFRLFYPKQVCLIKNHSITALSQASTFSEV